MKIVAPANDWKNAIQIEDDKKEYSLLLIEDIAKKLGLVISHDEKKDKLYLDLPRTIIQKTVDTIKSIPKKVVTIFTKKDKYRILFTMNLPSKAVSSLVEGFLILYKNDVETLRIKASSGQAGHQYIGHYWEIGKSPIPPSSDIIGSYEYPTDWYKPGDVSACGSRFYPIKPNPIHSKFYLDKSRTDIGGHFDENNTYSPGSAGCVVSLPRKTEEEKGWDDWKKAMDKINKLGIKWIPMEVIYK